MKGRVERGDLRDTGKPRRGSLDSSQRERVVQRSELSQLADCLPHAVVDQHRLLEAISAVDHAMADRIHRRHALQRCQNFALVPALLMPCP